MIDEWTIAASAMRRTADQVDQLVAENRQGLRDFTQEGLYEYTGLAQDAQRLVDQITASRKSWNAIPLASCLVTAPKASGRIEH